MRNLKLLTIASIVLYNIIVLPSVNLNPSPSITSYLFGLLLFLTPFLLLFAAAKAGLSNRLANICACLGAFVLMFVTYLVVINDATLIVPAVLISFGIFSAIVLVSTLTMLCINFLKKRQSTN